jgi:O-succinylbenzoic acid--CoA ligase
VLTSYGMTETGSAVTYDGVPLPGAEVRVVQGEIQVRGPMLFRAYRDGRDPKDAEGWFATGDQGEIADGVLRVLGRADDLIITGGENVWPTTVEWALHDHPAVADVAVVGRPDDEWGARVTALVVVSPGAEPPTLDEVRGWVKERLPAYAAPRALEIVSELPRTLLGKIQRRAV